MQSTTAFKDKTLMITGGTGSFGNTVLKHFVNTELAEIRIFSRDEKKQDDMRHRLQESSPELASKVRFFYRRRARCAICARCYARSRLHISCCSPKAGALMRVFSYGGG